MPHNITKKGFSVQYMTLSFHKFFLCFTLFIGLIDFQEVKADKPFEDSSLDNMSVDEQIKYHQNEAKKARSKVSEYDQAVQRSLSQKQYSDVRKAGDAKEYYENVQKYHEMAAKQLESKKQKAAQ